MAHASNKVTIESNIIVFKMENYSFSFIKNKQTRPRFLALANFISRLPPKKSRDIVFQSLSGCKDSGYREQGILAYDFFKIIFVCSN